MAQVERRLGLSWPRHYADATFAGRLSFIASALLFYLVGWLLAGALATADVGASATQRDIQRGILLLVWMLAVWPVVRNWWSLAVIALLAFCVFAWRPTPYGPAALWMIGWAVVIASPLSAVAGGVSSPRRSLGPNTIGGLLPLSPRDFRLASAAGRTLAAVQVTLLGTLLLLAARWAFPLPHYRLPAAPLWAWVALLAGWAWEAGSLALGLRAREPQATSPLIARLRRRWYALVAVVWRAHRCAADWIEFGRLTLPESDWLRWLRLPAFGALVVCLIALAAWPLVGAQQLGAMAVLLGLTPVAGACVALALWPGTMLATSDPYRWGRQGCEFQRLLPRRPRRLWSTRLLAAAIVMAASAAVPWLCSKVLLAVDGHLQASAELVAVSRISARAAALLLLAWPLVPLVWGPGQRRRWATGVALCGGFVAGVCLLSVLEGAGKLAPIICLGGAVLLGSISWVLADHNAWPLGRGDRVGQPAEALGFVMAMLPGIAIVQIAYWLVAGGSG